MDIIFQVAGVLAVFWSLKNRHWENSNGGLV
ncbi:not available [Yersinia enterocolitica]|nr:not available [Yersinia enterocolitica]